MRSDAADDASGQDLSDVARNAGNFDRKRGRIDAEARPEHGQVRAARERANLRFDRRDARRHLGGAEPVVDAVAAHGAVRELADRRAGVEGLYAVVLAVRDEEPAVGAAARWAGRETAHGREKELPPKKRKIAG